MLVVASPQEAEMEYRTPSSMLDVRFRTVQLQDLKVVLQLKEAKAKWAHDFEEPATT